MRYRIELAKRAASIGGHGDDDGLRRVSWHTFGTIMCDSLQEAKKVAADVTPVFGGNVTVAVAVWLPKPSGGVWISLDAIHSLMNDLDRDGRGLRAV